MDAAWPPDQQQVNGSPAQPLVLLVDDEPDIVAMTAAFLRRAGYRVAVAGDARSGERILREQPVELVVLDLGLPDGSGLDVLRRMRGRGGWPPVIIMSGQGADTERVVGLELGADDYVVKPVSLAELAARIRAVLRRAGPPGRAAEFRVGRLVIDTDARELLVDGRVLPMRPLEYELLAFLAAAPRRVFSNGQLLEHVWGSARQEPATVAEHVYRIRRKLDEAGVRSPRLVTVRGAGYRLDP
ncbi:MAG: response regulator transcription factor [Pseudonocardia sp.]